MKQVVIFDSTLREGMQSIGASYTVEDKIRLVELLDGLGVSYIEAGNPGSNPKDEELYKRLQTVALTSARLVAFGSTCRVGVQPEEDANLQALLSAGTPAVCIFGKSWDFQATEILGCTLEENLKIIYDSVAYCKAQGREVVYDAEHFFDGYKANPDYAMQTLQAAQDAGADWLCLCDTNGGCFPFEAEAIAGAVVERFGDKVGMHCHNDTGMAVANTVSGIRAGASMAQVTLHGWGERTGNADLFTVVPDLQLKLGFRCIPEERMETLVQVAAASAEIANIKRNHRAPYVGKYAFSHKGGMHIDAATKNPASFEHIRPELVGASRSFVLSEVAGRKAVLNKVSAAMPDICIEKDAPEAHMLVDALKDLEFKGYQFEGAEASFELVVRRLLGLYQPFFSLVDYKVIDAQRETDNSHSSAIVDILVDGSEEITAANGNGPVDALDRALRKALERFYPVIRKMRLIDYKVRVLDSRQAAGSKIRVLIESSDGTKTWSTVGVSTDVIEASWIAMVDALDYLLLQNQIS